MQRASDRVATKSIMPGTGSRWIGARARQVANQVVWKSSGQSRPKAASTAGRLSRQRLPV